VTGFASAAGPSLAVTAEACQPTPDAGVWRMTWRVRNDDVEPVSVLAAWLPHGRFRSPRRDLDPPATIAPAGDETLDFFVACREDAGTVVENAFVILNLRWRSADWRVFARLRVSFREDGAPDAETVLVTTQPVGFSQS